VSYIDASRHYYEAAGYEQPYEWASNDEVPFAVLTKPLERCRVGVVTTSYLPTNEKTTFVTRPDEAFAATHDAVVRLDNQALQWDKDETHTDDPETYLPLARLAEAAEAGRIASVSPRFYGVPTRYSQRVTRSIDAPAIEQAMRNDDVDVALLVPL
jgi:hypothetical protein